MQIKFENITPAYAAGELLEALVWARAEPTDAALSRGEAKADTGVGDG